MTNTSLLIVNNYSKKFHVSLFKTNMPFNDFIPYYALMQLTGRLQASKPGWICK